MDRDNPIAGLVEVGRWLQAQGYDFVTPTPETVRRNRERRVGVAENLRDVFGWSRDFTDAVLPDALIQSLQRAGALDVIEADRGARRYRSRVRYSTLGGRLYMHSAYPTEAADSVFFGPDTYRFTRFVGRVLAALPDPGCARRIVDIGAGSGAGGLYTLQRRAVEGDWLVLADINPQALNFAGVNATLADESRLQFALSDVLQDIDGDFDVIVSNPPYMADALARAYRDGGALQGAELSVRILAESLPRLAPGGVLVLYTGSAVIDGVDSFRAAALPLLLASGMHHRYDEIDPDVFGEELDAPGYAHVERIAAVGLVVRAPQPDG